MFALPSQAVAYSPCFSIVSTFWHFPRFIIFLNVDFKKFYFDHGKKVLKLFFKSVCLYGSIEFYSFIFLHEFSHFQVIS